MYIYVSTGHRQTTALAQIFHKHKHSVKLYIYSLFPLNQRLLEHVYGEQQNIDVIQHANIVMIHSTIVMIHSTLVMIQHTKHDMRWKERNI